MPTFIKTNANINPNKYKQSFIGGHPPLQLKGPRLFGLENCPPDDLENIFFRACRYTIFKSRHQGPIISLDLFKQLVRDELSVKYRGNRYRRLLERKEEVSAICWHSLAMEGQLLWPLKGRLVPVSHNKGRKPQQRWKVLTRHCGSRGPFLGRLWCPLPILSMLKIKHSTPSIVSYPTRWSLYSSLDFCVDHLSWQWRPHIAGCKMFLTLLRAELAVLTHFFCKMYQWYMWGRQKPENGVFLSLFSPPKWPRKLTHDCFPKIRIDPYIWEALLMCWRQGGKIKL